jgi:hypothetical protein
MSMTEVAPPIFAPRAQHPPLGWTARGFALAIAGACLAVLALAATVEPDPSGTGTHTALGLGRCTSLYLCDLPCPSCGMTTSYAHFVRGQLLASLWVQPFGTLLAALTIGCFWTCLYVAVSGRSVFRLVRLMPVRYYLVPLLMFAIASWGWKIFIHMTGIDGSGSKG